jgi:hypothetical protein
MTQHEFNQLPLLLKPALVREVLGCSRQGLRLLREEHPQIVHSHRPRGQYLFLKLEVGRLAKLKDE